MLHTQIIQPSLNPPSSNAFMGWGYAGGNRYRSNGASIHSFFENLFNYYYLTGDMEVIDVLDVGGTTKRKWYTRDRDGNLNDPSIGTGYSPEGRIGTETAFIFNFLGHVHDESFNDDFKHMYNHIFSRQVALLTQGGVEYGFLINDEEVVSGFHSEQFWMGSLYTMHALYILYNEWGDLQLGADNIAISRVFKAVAQGHKKFSAANNDWDSSWINTVDVNYSGNRVGGTIVSAVDGGGILYSTGKYPIITMMLRAGKIADNSELTQFGLDGLNWGVNNYNYTDLHETAWGKVNAIIMNRFHHAMAYIESN